MMSIESIIYPRCSPYIWDIIGYIGGVTAIFYYDKNGILAFSCSFVLYGLLNMFFDSYTVSFDYSNNNMPNYKQISNFQNFYIYNKKYILQNKNNSIPFDKIIMIDDSKIKLELNIYVGDYTVIKYILLVIYLTGITKKNYTMNGYNTFNDTKIHFV
jgi:hypothetical protein